MLWYYNYDKAMKYVWLYDVVCAAISNMWYYLHFMAAVSRFEEGHHDDIIWWPLKQPRKASMGIIIPGWWHNKQTTNKIVVYNRYHDLQ